METVQFPGMFANKTLCQRLNIKSEKIAIKIG